MSRTRKRRPILLVEDDPDIREAVAEILQQEGFAVVTASNGREDRGRLAQMVRPCLILLDMNMPVMDGREFMDRAREDPELRACTVLIVTAERIAPPLGAAGTCASPSTLTNCSPQWGATALTIEAAALAR